MTSTTETESKELRRVRLLDMRNNKKMTLGAIAKIEKVTRSRIGQLIGNTGHIRPVNQSLLAIYRFIDAYHIAHHYAPSFAEIAKAFPARNGNPASTSVVWYWLDRMAKLNMCARSIGINRSVHCLPLDRRNPVIREMLRIEEAQAEVNNEENKNVENG